MNPFIQVLNLENLGIGRAGVVREGTSSSSSSESIDSNFAGFFNGVLDQAALKPNESGLSAQDGHGPIPPLALGLCNECALINKEGLTPGEKIISDDVPGGLARLKGSIVSNSLFTDQVQNSDSAISTKSEGGFSTAFLDGKNGGGTGGIPFKFEGELGRDFIQQPADSIINRMADHLNVKEVRLSSNDAARQLHDTLSLNRNWPGHLHVQGASDADSAIKFNSEKSKGRMRLEPNGLQSSNNDDSVIEEVAVCKGKTGQKAANGNGIAGNHYGTADRMEFVGESFGKSVESNSLRADTDSISTNTIIGSGKTSVENTRSEATPMRFILPDNLHKAGLKNNRTIYIKMEPEHLGTVRLTLSSHHNGISGRMIVGNLSALSAIETNLSSLFDELAEKGIRLNDFQVSVGGGQTGQRFSQSEVASGLRLRTGRHEAMEKLENEYLMSGESWQSRLYVNAKGVNWLV